ncbi:hypothetical protein [Streptomyces sp. NPDC088400]|uniref:hypothetical protein n=1 Tax=Streptomyces sp. NPDC088400 TaxID=3365861 RepID=UPI00380EEA60
MITGEDTVSGTALLLAAAPAGKGCLIDAASALPALAAVSPSTLTGTAAATVIELADPLAPQTVLTRIRAAAATAGPLSLYIAGQLHLDHKQRLVHLALARTTPTTLRYTGLPWHWLTGELKLRRPGTTTVVVDLVADAEAWEQLGVEGLALGYGTRLYGRVAPPPPRRTIIAPAYLNAYAAIWRSGAQPPLAQLHQQAATRAGTEGALLLAVDAPPALTAPVEDGARTVQRAAPVQGGAASGWQPVSEGRPVFGESRAASASTPASASPPAPGGAPAPGSEPERHDRTPAPPPPGSHAPVTAELPADDPHPAILAAARAGRHTEAATIAAMWESETLRMYGPGSTQAIHWLEVRADLARLAQDAARSCELWTAAAEARLARRQPPGDEEVEAAADRAHHQWEQIDDQARAGLLAPALVALRRQVPGRRPGALQAIERRLENLPSAHGKFTAF